MSKKKTNKATTIPNKTLQGSLEITKGGLGYVTVEGFEEDIIIRPEFLGQALHTDIVTLVIIKVSKSGRKEGKILSVVKRNTTEFTGRIEMSKNFAFFVPDSERMQSDIFIPLPLANGAKNGDRVVAEITDWPSRAKNPIGKVVKVFSEEDLNDHAMTRIMVEAGFPLEFSDEAMEIALRQSDIITDKEIEKRKDFRKITTFTIDPVDAKDFDDAISYKNIGKGWFELGVHIADVSHYLKEGNQLDLEAFERATSVYLPDRVLPMLPERLSNELCSLRPNEDKCCFSCIFTINDQGKIKNTWIGRTVINSNHRFTYEEVQEVIEGHATTKYDKEIHRLHELTQLLRQQRLDNGAINFSSEEVRFILDENKKPIGITVKVSKAAHQLIEELMLLANKAVATFVSETFVKGKPLPFPYRVHDQPDEEKLNVFSTFAAKYGHKFNFNTPETIAASFNEMLQLAQGRPELHVLETLGIRTMSKAVYTTNNIGHYGLGFENYCHFTSPIRRYPDILVHRIVQTILDGKPRVIKGLEEQCKHCSNQERKAMDCERAGTKFKQVEFMQTYIGEEFDAIVSGVSQFGFWAETVAHKCEGLIPMHDLKTIDFFEHRPSEYALVGTRSGLKIRMGDKVTIKVVAANLDKRQLDFSLVALSDVPSLTEEKSTPKKKKTAEKSKAKTRKKQ